MIECQHKSLFPVTNMGIEAQICGHFGQSVNDDLCSGCPLKSGYSKPKLVELTFPRRSDQEIEAVYAVCQACPLFDQKTKECKRLKLVGHPTDIYAQNPANHCPEGLW